MLTRYETATEEKVRRCESRVEGKKAPAKIAVNYREPACKSGSSFVGLIEDVRRPRFQYNIRRGLVETILSCIWEEYRDKKFDQGKVHWKSDNERQQTKGGNRISDNLLPGEQCVSSR